MAEDARQRVAAVAHVKSVYTTIGGGSAGSDPFAGGSNAETRKATLTITLDARGERPRKQGIEADIRTALETLPGVRKGGPGRLGREVCAGAHRRRPAGAADRRAGGGKDLRTIPGLGSISSTASLVRSEIAVRPDFARAADLGVTSSAIAETLRIATVGDYDTALPKLNLASRQVPIVVKLQDDARKDLSVLERLPVPGAKGPVLLGQVATLEFSGGPPWWTATTAPAT